MKVLAHAANYFTIYDRDRAIRILTKAAKLDPANAAWPHTLGELHMFNCRTSRKRSRTKSAREALKQFERAYELTDQREGRYLRESLAKAAFAANRPLKARAHATAMLRSRSRGWERGNHKHAGNIILGRLALQNDDVCEAKRRLLAASKTPGSPQLDSFGPNMKLAKELLERGEREAVLEYLENCKAFWKNRDELKEWPKRIRDGKIPDFGANLY